MAVMTMNFCSKELKMNTTVAAVFPDSVRINDKPLAQRKCLYLLHGLSDDATACIRLSNVERYAEENDVVVVMPSVNRSMYCDDVHGQNYFTYIAKELPEYLELVLGLSGKKESTYIAGISMGGMGAARVGLIYPERFAGVALFSGLLNIKMMLPFVTDEQKNDFPFLLNTVDVIDTTPLNPINLLDAEKHKGLSIDVYCGKQDNLFLMSTSFVKKAEKLNLSVASHYGDGSHEWRLWDAYIEDYITKIAGDAFD